MNASKLGILGGGVAIIGVFLMMQNACNTGFADCPAKESITSGGSCSDDNLQCPYDLVGPAPACDGTQATINTSCTCDKGHWSCPDSVSCEAGGGGDDGGTTDEGGGTGDASPADASSG